MSYISVWIQIKLTSNDLNDSVFSEHLALLNEVYNHVIIMTSMSFSIFRVSTMDKH